MNGEEELAETYLRSLRFRDVVFEPDGNVPPDFSLDGTIAVEVRRLNQQFFAKDDVRGLEETRIPLFNLLESSLSEFDSRYDGYSYGVSVRFRRPFGRGKSNRKAILKALTGFLSQPFIGSCEVEVTETVSFNIFPIQAVEDKVFRFAGGTDRESGGWKLPEFTKNLSHCIEEKTLKIKDYQYKYKSWWLVLVDKIAYGFDDNEKDEVKAMLSPNSSFDKVIVLDSLAGRNIIEI
jgi:hypothetical protein